MIEGHHTPFYKHNQASTSSSTTTSSYSSSNTESTLASSSSSVFTSSHSTSAFTSSSSPSFSPRAWLPTRRSRSLVLNIITPSLLLCQVASALPSPLQKRQDTDNGLTAASVADDDTPGTTPTISTYLPAQIGGIVGSYALSLVLVALGLLILSKRRREHLNAGDNEVEFLQHVDKPQQIVTVAPEEPQYNFPPQSPRSIPRSPIVLQTDNIGGFTPIESPHEHLNAYVLPSPTSTVKSPLGVDPTVDQSVVKADREMAQSQLEDMYKYVMEHEEAKLKGVELPPIPIPTGGAANPRVSNSSSGPSTPSTIKKEKAKPAHLNLGQTAPEEKRQSKASALFSALRSPRRKMKGVSISSPIMTPMSGTFPRESQELNIIPPRQYAPAAPPPVPTDQFPFRGSRNPMMPLTPELSPDGTQSIDERLGNLPLDTRGHSRNVSLAPTEGEPESAISATSQTPLVGLPQSPKPGVNRFPSLPASPRSLKGPMTLPLPQSPKPGASFSRPNAPSAVRTGGALPLRAYESSLASPTRSTVQTKQTVFERMGPLSPTGKTPFTGTAVPYSPYQPFTPCIPLTPSLVTKADRKRMRKLEPKTPTLQMVKSSDEMW